MVSGQAFSKPWTSEPNCDGGSPDWLNPPVDDGHWQGGLDIKNTALLRRKILSRQAVIGVIGQGYVGLSLAAVAADEGFPVIGVDIDEDRVEGLAAGTMVVPGVREDEFRAGFATGRMNFTTDFGSLVDCDVVLICVPTPLRDGSPDLSFVEIACTEVAKRLSPGCLVILESTTYPGTTDQLVKPLLEASGLMAGRDFLLGYSPERIDPGNQEYSFRQIPRVVGGSSPEAAGASALFYSQIVDKVFPVSSCAAAELAKLLENTYRHVNIALVNELSMLCHDMGIEVWEVIEAAATKPFGFVPFRPGPGVGGHCIPLDPGYLAWQVRRDAGRQFRLLEQAQDVNAQMPIYVSSRIGDALNDHSKSVRGARVLVLGVTYKEDIGDIRESPALKVMSLLDGRGAKVAFYDPYVETLTVNGTVLHRTGLTKRVLSQADCVAIITPHSAFDFQWIAENADLIFDSRNVYGDTHRTNVTPL